MYILNIVNSFIGKKGNIGLRTSYIINELNKQNIDNFSYSRGALNEYKQKNKNMGIFGQIPRILNAYRIYFNLNFNHRKYDIWIFELIFNILFKNDNQKNKIAHIWEFSPNIIKKLKKHNYKVILDIPIAPSSTSKELINKYKNSIVLHPHKYNINMEKKALELSDIIIAPSVFVKEEIIKLGIAKNKISLVPFGIELKDGYKKKFDKNYKENGIDFCFAGTINKRKGVEFLLQAWDDEIFKNDRLHLCGRLYPEIETLLKRYNFKNVILPGFINTNEYFKKCDIYVFPSLLEGSSKSIYEAMNASMPCIVTANSGSIIKNNEDGLIVDVASFKSIKDAMLKYKLDNKLISYMGANGYKNVQKYSWDTYANNVIDIYKKSIL